jgi:hypothetical protein
VTYKMPQGQVPLVNTPTYVSACKSSFHECYRLICYLSRVQYSPTREHVVVIPTGISLVSPQTLKRTLARLTK